VITIRTIKRDILEWVLVWWIIIPYAIAVCTILYLIEKYEDIRYNKKIEI